MSVNRRGRSKGMRRAYLKSHTLHKRAGYATNPEVKPVQITEPSTAEPIRRRKWNYSIDGTAGNIGLNKPLLVSTTPRMTKPYAERTDALRKAQAGERREIHRIKMVETSFFIVWHVFNGFDPAAQHWLEMLNIARNTIDRSITFPTKEKARAELKRDEIRWKERGIPNAMSKL